MAAGSMANKIKYLLLIHNLVLVYSFFGFSKFLQIEVSA